MANSWICVVHPCASKCIAGCLSWLMVVAIPHLLLYYACLLSKPSFTCFQTMVIQTINGFITTVPRTRRVQIVILRRWSHKIKALAAFVREMSLIIQYRWAGGKIYAELISTFCASRVISLPILIHLRKPKEPHFIQTYVDNVPPIEFPDLLSLLHHLPKHEPLNDLDSQCPMAAHRRSRPLVSIQRPFLRSASTTGVRENGVHAIVS